jgi:serine/threonine-protein kinase HipA
MDIQGTPIPVGTLWARSSGNRQSATFEYHRDWLQHSDRFAIEPALTVDAGPHHTAGNTPLFGALSDSAPDRWGRMLMRRAERRLSEKESRAPRALQEIDFLLGVQDVSRMGALRFAETEGGPFLADSSLDPIPPLIALPKLLSASEHVIADEETDDDLLTLLAPGTSLGGARPKASIMNRDGQLSIAKFPSQKDEWTTELWESVALGLARDAGIETPHWTVENLVGKSVLLLQRFDRQGPLRIPFLSAMSMLGARDHETRCYLEMVDALRRHGATPRDDIQALFRRIVFNILISNTDDHLRNHAFLMPDARGWRLSPAYDLNPIPADVRPRMLSTEIDMGNATASLGLAFQVAPYFELDAMEAERIVGEVGRVVATWRDRAAHVGISQQEIHRMASAFDHADLEQALKLASR